MSSLTPIRLDEIGGTERGTSMIEMLCGAAGAAVVLLSFYFGFRFGCSFSHATPAADELSEDEKEEIMKERKRLIAEQNAFTDMMGYNANVAYGIAAKEVRNE